MQNSILMNEGFRPARRQARVTPVLAGIVLLILGTALFPPCSAVSAPVAQFVSNISSGNIPLDVQFIDSSSNTPASWFWSFGDGGTSTLQNPVHSYTTAGTYTVILASTNAAGSNTSTRTGYITTSQSASSPMANFVANATSGTVPLGVQFVDLSTNAPSAWVWSFGDGGSSTLQNPFHAYTSAGTYTVTLTATNGGGSNTMTKTNYISAGKVAAIPVASFVASATSGTAPLTVYFVDQSTNSPSSWIWSFGDGNISTVQNPSHTFTTSDSYSVTLIASNAAGSDTITKTGYVTVTYAEPVANFTADVTSGTAPLTVQFTDTSTNSPTTWSWKFGDGGKSSEQNPTHKYTDMGSYTVTLTAINSAGSNITKIVRYINVSAVSEPVASFNGEPRSGKVPFSVHFNDTSSNSPTTWAWSFGDGLTSTEQNPNHVYRNPGTYTVSLTAGNDAGNTSRTETDYISAGGETTPTPSSATIAQTEETPASPETTAAVTATRTTAPAASASGSSMLTYIIAGLVIIVVIGAGAIFYFRNRGSGGHHHGRSQL